MQGEVDWVMEDCFAEIAELSSRLEEIERLYGLYDLFSDMDLTKYEDDLFAHESKTQEGEWVQEHAGRPEDISLSGWRLRYVEDEGRVGGRCIPSEKTILLMHSYRDDNLVLLHELIHAYESMLEEHLKYLQYVLLRLYMELSKQIPNLLGMLNVDTHIVFSVHTPLFLLKALDLDLRLNLPLGTMYSYERTEMF